MIFEVILSPSAEDDLAELWLDSKDRRRITDAANQLNKRLQSNPQDQGESRDKGRRITWEPPLGALFKVLSEKRIVYITHIWLFDTRTSS